MTIAAPISERYIISSKVSRSAETSRPATAISENETIAPVIHSAARAASPSGCEARAPALI